MKLVEALEELPSRTQSSDDINTAQGTAANPRGSPVLDYTLNNPDTLTKYKTAAAISQKVLESVAGACLLSLPLSPDRLFLSPSTNLTALFRMVSRG